MNPAERAEFVQDVAQAIISANKPLTDDEQRWVRMAIQREAKSAQFREAIINKTMGGLIWFALLGIGAILLDYLKLHGWKL